MTTPEKWWVPPPEFESQAEQNRLDFKEQFGSFEAAECSGFWVGTSMDGQWLAFHFDRPDGSVVRIALPDAQQFLTEVMGTLDEMVKRQLGQAETHGSA
ncbi:conserved hypothetical protein [Mesorhizobium prunaredense]|uniref:Uncharacterized protein n=1 Tax=Mesorhizobium prunaredense TaxID=1631249 RepID=A0A1R3V091_9HYPH|nr:hypothetical protein [Mesorhizobium prunaredense]SIT52644.1 conserved hypothetical protein [Mesorhizobium prunaredense]